MKRILSGIQPTNKLTLGNYLGAIRNWVQLQQNLDQGDACESLYVIVDLHAITVPQDPKQLRKATLETAAAYIASGIDPQKNSLFVQSHITEHTELGWMLGCMTPMGWLSRMTQFKDKSGKNRDQAGLGLFAYPALMAADILLYQTTHVPVGEDQKQHIELARDLALSVNHHFGEDFFTVPEPLIKGQGARIMSLRDGTRKMSKSDPSDFSRIHLCDTDDEISLKIRKAKTDPEPLPESVEELEGRLEALNLLTIFASLQDKTVASALEDVAGMPFSSFKPLLADLIIDALSPIREKMTALLEDEAYLRQTLQVGAEKARPLAQSCLAGFKKRLGLLEALSF